VVKKDFSCLFVTLNVFSCRWDCFFFLLLLKINLSKRNEITAWPEAVFQMLKG